MLNKILLAVILFSVGGLTILDNVEKEILHGKCLSDNKLNDRLESAVRPWTKNAVEHRLADKKEDCKNKAKEHFSL